MRAVPPVPAAALLLHVAARPRAGVRVPCGTSGKVHGVLVEAAHHGDIRRHGGAR